MAKASKLRSALQHQSHEVVTMRFGLQSFRGQVPPAFESEFDRHRQT